MMMEVYLRDVLSDCIDRLMNGKGVDECLAQYPEFRTELLSLLQVASATLDVSHSLQYRTELKSRSLTRILGVSAQRNNKWRILVGWLNWRYLVVRPIVAGVIACMLILGTTFGLNAASHTSLPGDPLYTVKTAREKLTLILPQADVKKVRTHIHLAGVRGHEMRELSKRRKFVKAGRMGKRIRHHLKQSSDVAGVNQPTSIIEMPVRSRVLTSDVQIEELKRLLKRDQVSLVSTLNELISIMSPSEQRRLESLMSGSVRDYQMLIASFDAVKTHSR